MPSKTVVSLCLAAAVAFAPRPAAAQQKVEARRSASANAPVEIENPAGSIRVIGWERGEVTVTGDLGAGASGSLHGLRQPHPRGVDTGATRTASSPRSRSTCPPRAAQIRQRRLHHRVRVAAPCPRNGQRQHHATGRPASSAEASTGRQSQGRARTPRRSP